MNRRCTAQRAFVSICLTGCLLAMTTGLSCPGQGGDLSPSVPPGNRPPRIIITSVVTPAGNNLAEQGDPVSISFTGDDGEDASVVRVFVSTFSNPTPAQEIPVISGFPVGPGVGSGTAILDTSTVVTGSYFIFAEIDDRTFDPVTGTGNPAVRVTYQSTILVTPLGTAPENGAPTIIPRLPNIDTGVSNDDLLLVRFDISDPNSTTDTLNVKIFFDKDLDSSNDASQPPVQADTFSIASGTPDNVAVQTDRQILIDLNSIPVRKETDEFGRPLAYFVRIQADDGNGGVTDRYAAGAVRVLAAGSGVVDLLTVGGRTAGATFQGVTGVPTDPRYGDHAGSSFARLGDLDNDGLDDFAIVSESASPFNQASVGEVYTIYGRSRHVDPDLPNSAYFQGRFSGVLSLNSVGAWVSFPPSDPRFRNFFVIRGHAMPHTHESNLPNPGLGITSVVAMPDVTGDGRPEIFAGAPYNQDLVDEEDMDPCDSCTFPTTEVAPFVCYVDIRSMAGDDALTAQATGITQDLPPSQWAPTTPPNDGVSTPNVDLTLASDRILSISEMRIIVSGSVPGAMAMGSVTLDFQLESACGYSFSTSIMHDMAGQLTETTIPISVPSNTPPSAPPAVNNFDPLPPSVYDGRFALFVKASARTSLNITVEVDAIVGSPESHAIRFTYFDGMPFPISTVEGCGLTTPEPANPLTFNYLVSSFFASDSAPTVPPINRVVGPYGFVISTGLALLADPSIAFLYRIYTDGHLCESVTPIFSDFSLNNRTEDDGIGPYQSGMVYMAASDQLVTTLNANGVWNGDGCPVQPLGQFGQDYGGCLNDAIRGARFRGAWYNPLGIQDGVGGGPGVVGPYDPTSLEGYTVDVMPDLNGIFSPSSEFLMSGPGSGGIVTLSTDLTVALGGSYTASSMSCRTTAFDVQQTYSQVLAAGLTIRGTSLNLARLRLSLNRGCGTPYNGKDTTIQLWTGTVDVGNQPSQLLFSQFFGSRVGMTPACNDLLYNFGSGLVLKLPVVPELQFAGNFVSIPIDVGADLTTGAGTLTLEILPDATIKNSSANITSAVFTISGLVPGQGHVWILEGQDYTDDISISALCNSAEIATNGDQQGGATRPMSWPSTGCDAVPNPNVRDFCYPQPLAYMIGETIGDAFGWAHWAGDLNSDQVADITCGSPLADSDPITPDLVNCPPIGEPTPLVDNGKVYLIYGTPTLGNGEPCRYNRLEIRGSHAGDEFGRVQGRVGDMNGDGRDDMYFAAEKYDALPRPAAPLGITENSISNKGADAGFVAVLFGGSPGLTGEIARRPEVIGTPQFKGCIFVGGSPGAHLGGSEPAKTSTLFYPIPPNVPGGTELSIRPIIDRGQEGVKSAGDFNLDGVDDLLITAPGQEWPGAKFEFVGNVPDGAFVSISGRSFEFDTNGSVAGGRTRVPISSTSPAVAQAALLAALEVAGNDETFNLSALTSRLEFPDPLPDTPTITFLARTPAGFSASSSHGSIVATTTIRQGVAYLVFGSPSLLNNKVFYLPDDLNRRVGANRVLKGIVFVSAYEKNTPAENDGVYDISETPDEAPVEAVSGIGDVDGDGFPDIIVGAPRADYVNILTPSQRRQATGEAYLIYGNNFGLNKSSAP